MAFYNLSKNQREELISTISADILSDISSNKDGNLKKYFSDEDTYIRKASYINISCLYKNNPIRREQILSSLEELFQEENANIRQTVVNAFGEIGRFDPTIRIFNLMEIAMNDDHSKVRNAVIGSLKKIGELKSEEVINFCKKFLHHPDWKIRRQVIHGIELRGENSS